MKIASNIISNNKSPKNMNNTFSLSSVRPVAFNKSSFIKKNGKGANPKSSFTDYQKFNIVGKDLNASMISNISKEAFNLDLQSIRDILEVMKKHEKKCNEEGKFVEAGLLKDRIEQFKKVEEIKVYDEVVAHHKIQKEQLEYEQGDALERFNAYYDELFGEVNKEYEQREKEMVSRHKQDLERLKEDVANFFPEHPKPSAQIIKKNNELKNLQKLRK